MLVYRQGAPADSFYIDMTSFVTMTPPPVGTVIDSVQGVLQGGGTRAGFAGIQSWRIAIRACSPTSNTCSDDIFIATAPEVAEAYPVANDSVKVLFDRDVTEASATVPGHYTLQESERAIDYVRMSGDNAIVAHIANANTWPVGDIDSVVAVSMTGKVNGLTQTDPRKGIKGFVNGILPIPMIQAPNPDSLSVCVDRSKFAGPGTGQGPRISFRGTVTGKFFGREYYIQEAAGGPRSGVKLFQPSAPLTVGHKYLIVGRALEFFNETEIDNIIFVQDEGVGVTPPFFTGTLQQLDDFACDNPPGLRVGPDAVTNGEDYEGCLVKFSHNLLTSDDATFGPGSFFHATNANTLSDSTDIEVDCISDSSYDPNPNEYIQVQGVLAFRFNQGVIFPRHPGDVVLIGPAGVNPGTPGRVSFSLYPNPSRTAQLTFALPKRDDVELAVFDLVGRRLATIARGSFAAGTYTRKWDGRTETGAQLGAGMYFYRLKVGSETFNLRGVRLK
jgi:hypothetical protein